MSMAGQFIGFHKGSLIMTSDQKRTNADNADYLLEVFGRTVVSESLSPDEKSNALEGLLDHIGTVAMNIDYRDGQTLMNRAFHVAKSSTDQTLSDRVAKEAIDRDFETPEDSIRMRLMELDY